MGDLESAQSDADRGHARPLTVLRLTSAILWLATSVTYLIYGWKLAPLLMARAIGLGSTLLPLHETFRQLTGSLIVVWAVVAVASTVARMGKAGRRAAWPATLLALCGVAVAVSLMVMLSLAAWECVRQMR
jgi:hypothetical protein